MDQESREQRFSRISNLRTLVDEAYQVALGHLAYCRSALDRRGYRGGKKDGASQG